eukprot:CAMPEP_0181313358 /NCGR_PEP_ID=MMETSP1101-20121128/14205_1 /TAXON_ID=46948 /ORGANISM="Rhodomonas abbreviata, Strain Caron Lab Isolate" /LENGTH=487 /DNA_ID=CAMNT_0023420305 /DNA_START=135 /DNA_END=1598 /DNA_ORIENTATION=-
MATKNNSGRFAPDFMIMQRRKEEEHRRVYDDKFKSDTSLQRVAQWEQKTSSRIERNAASRRVDSMARDLESDLDARRARLAAMLAEEDAAYTMELEALDETPDMRRDRLKARARELVRRREHEKREFANQMRERQFRESCDAFREHDGQQLLRECMVARDRALEEKAEEKQRNKEEEVMWHNRLLELVRKAEQREEKDKNRDVELRSEMLRTLQEQVKELKERKEEDERLKQEEARLMRERFELDLAEARQKEEERAAMFADKKAAIARHNAILRAEKEAEVRRQQEEDLKLLNAMLDKERKAEEAEMHYKQQLKTQAREYQAQLIELMKKEAVDEAASEAIRHAEQDKAWRKREEVWEKEKAARDKLMKEVMLVRRQQLEHRLAENRAQRQLALEERERTMAEVAELQGQQRLSKAIRDNIAKEHQKDILMQVEEARQRMRREMDTAALELEASRREEAAYQAKLEREMRVQRPPKNHGLKSTGLF